jgi:tetratricopeptide (TPR) repeat protein
MRAAAMRLLSQALDMEEQDPPRTWRDEREQLLMALARTAVEGGAIDDALTIGGRISHAERRGMIETEVVRALLAAGALERATAVAGSIGHDGMREWAISEVAVSLARTGQPGEAERLLAGLTLETANAWGQIELACDQARGDEHAALARIELLPSESQRDRGRARLAHALAQAAKDGDALHVAGQISNVAVRVAALLDLRLTLEGLVAMLALEEATAAISELTSDDRVPLMAALAAAHAALGRRERALRIVQQLAEGEERDRALARVAVALAGAGDHEQARTVAALLNDDDERDWVFDELTRLLVSAKRWEEALALGSQVAGQVQRARTLAELYIAQASSGDAAAAYAHAANLAPAAERDRALTAIIPALIAAGHSAQALAGQALFDHSDTLSRYQAALVSALVFALGEHPIDVQRSGKWQEAYQLAQHIARRTDRSNALLALAQAAASTDPALAQTILGEALHTVATSRAEALRCVEQAAALLMRLGEPRLLPGIAAAIEEIDAL